MALPNFMIIGAQKSGTTWLAHNLRHHPDVFMPEGEVHFFSSEQNRSKGLSWYQERFAGVTSEKAIGEKTPEYLCVGGERDKSQWPDVHKRIHETLPDVKLIVLLRNPVERAISAVHHQIRQSRISPLHNLDDVLLGHNRAYARFRILEYGNYFSHIQAYHECFDPKQMLILIYEEDVAEDPVSGLKKVCEFLDIDSSFQFPAKQKRVGKRHSSRVSLVIRYYLPFLRRIARFIDPYFPDYNKRPSDSAVQQMYEMFSEENEKLFELLERRPTSWLKSS